MYSLALLLFVYAGGADIAPFLVLLVELALALCAVYEIKAVICPRIRVVVAHY